MNTWKIIDIYKEPSGWFWKPHIFRWDAINDIEADYYGCWHFKEFTWLWFTVEMIKKEQ
jgi:hypothetical protein